MLRLQRLSWSGKGHRRTSSQATRSRSSTRGPRSAARGFPIQETKNGAQGNLQVYGAPSNVYATIAALGCSRDISSIAFTLLAADGSRHVFRHEWSSFLDDSCRPQMMPLDRIEGDSIWILGSLFLESVAGSVVFDYSASLVGLGTGP